MVRTVVLPIAARSAAVDETSRLPKDTAIACQETEPRNEPQLDDCKKANLEDAGCAAEKPGQPRKVSASLLPIPSRSEENSTLPIKVMLPDAALGKGTSGRSSKSSGTLLPIASRSGEVAPRERPDLCDTAVLRTPVADELRTPVKGERNGGRSHRSKSRSGKSRSQSSPAERRDAEGDEAAGSRSRRSSVPSSSTKKRPSFHEHFHCGKVLGTGVGGNVVEASCKRTGERFAVKTYRKASMKPSQAVHMRSEIAIHESLSHPKLVRLEGVYESAEKVRVVLELVAGGELFDRILDHVLTEAEARDITMQLLSALAYLHEQGVVHRDLKPENILMEAADSNQIKLVDFGFAARMGKDGKVEGRVGTLRYAAPEVLRGESYGAEADLWSLGSLVNSMLTQRSLFSGNDAQVMEKNKSGKVQFCEHFTALSAEAQDFVRQLTAVDGTKRPSAVKAMQHPWLQPPASAKEKKAETTVRPVVTAAAVPAKTFVAEPSPVPATPRKLPTKRVTRWAAAVKEIRESKPKYMEAARIIVRSVFPMASTLDEVVA